MGTRYFNSSDGILLPQNFNERSLSQNGLVFLTKPEVKGGHSGEYSHLKRLSRTQLLPCSVLSSYIITDYFPFSRHYVCVPEKKRKKNRREVPGAKSKMHIF